MIDPSTSPKNYWSVPKSFLNNKKYHVFCHFPMKIVLLLILNVKLSYLILFLLISVP